MWRETCGFQAAAKHRPAKYAAIRIFSSRTEIALASLQKVNIDAKVPTWPACFSGNDRKGTVMRSTSDYQPPVSLAAFACWVAGAGGTFCRRTSVASVRRTGATAPEQPARSAEYAGADRAVAERDPERGVLYQRRRARYLLANLTLAKRCGFKTVTPLLGGRPPPTFSTPSSDPAHRGRICGYCATAC